MLKEQNFKFEVFCENHPLTLHIKHKVIDFAPSNESITASSLFQPI